MKSFKIKLSFRTDVFFSKFTFQTLWKLPGSWNSNKEMSGSDSSPTSTPLEPAREPGTVGTIDDTIAGIVPLEPAIKSATVVTIDDTIAEIVQYLQWQDLISCRHVTSYWMPIATRYIRRICRSHFRYDRLGNFYYDDKGVRLKKLIETARNSDKSVQSDKLVSFPCVSFSFQGGNMCSPDAKEFFEVIGKSVVELTLKAFNNYWVPNMNLATILKGTPNLETLILELSSDYDSNPTDQLKLPSLKCIKFRVECSATLSPAITVLLNGAPKLQRIDGVWHLEDIEPIVTTRKMRTIKSWWPPVSLPGRLIQLADASEDELALDELLVFIGEDNFHVNGDEIDAGILWKCYKKLLKKNSIQKLILRCSNFPGNVSFPSDMNNVKELVLIPLRDPQTLRHFSRNIQLYSTFPRLHTLSFHDVLNYDHEFGREWLNCFPLSGEFENFNQILKTVTTLNLRGRSTSTRMLRKMKNICPNIQNLEIYLYDQLDQTQIVWELCGEWRHLTKLTINLERWTLNSNDSLDFAFTGNDPEFLESLNNNHLLTAAGKLAKATKTRNALWIGNMTGLIQLVVVYYIPCHRARPSKFIPFTTFSGQYAFKTMPKLAVRLSYSKCKCRDCKTDSKKIKNALRSLSPFATIIRNSRDY